MRTIILVWLRLKKRFVEPAGVDYCGCRKNRTRAFVLKQAITAFYFSYLKTVLVIFFFIFNVKFQCKQILRLMRHIFEGDEVIITIGQVASV